MDRKELLRRQQSRTAQRGIPGWLWGLLVGGVVAFVAAGVLMRPGGVSNDAAGQAQNPQTPAPGSSVPAQQPPAITPSQMELAPQYPAEVTVAPREPNRQAQDETMARQAEELDRLRDEVESLRRDRESGPAAEDPRAQTPPPQQVQEPAQSEPSVMERTEEAEREWRPVFADFQKRYSQTKKEHDDRVNMLKQYQAQCSYTQMGEPTEAQKRRGVRQEGLPANMVMGGTIDYTKLNCDSIDLDLRQAEQDRSEVLRDIQRECYDDAVARGVSMAKARLR